jgi:hypothetical protein
MLIMVRGDLNPYHEHHIVRIRWELKKARYLKGKHVYNYYRYELTIPVKYKDILEQFMNKDLKVEAKQEGNNLIIKAEPKIELGQNVQNA